MSKRHIGTKAQRHKEDRIKQIFVRGFLGVFVPLCLRVDTWAQGCSMCRAALESSPEGKTIAAGLAHGILMMLILPYGLMATFGFFIYRAIRKKSKERQQNSYSYQAESGR